MKTLSLHRPLILMMVGLPGAGKSFFARQFSDTFGVPVVSADRLRFELFAKPTFSKDEQTIISRVAEYQIDELLKTKRSFLVDGVCNSRAERQVIEKSAFKAGYGALVIWVQTDEATSKHRATHRKTDRPGDTYNVTLPAEQFAALAKQYVPPLREPYVVISGKHAYSTQAKMVLRRLAAPHAAQAEEAHRQERIGGPSRPSSTTPSSSRRVLIR